MGRLRKSEYPAYKFLKVDSMKKIRLYENKIKAY